jgi:hypothetical protein
MRLAALSLALLLAMGATALTGCMRTSNESGLSDADTDPRRGDPVAYYEAKHEGKLYILGSIRSLDNLRAGKPPATTAAGFSSGGQAVLFETDSAGLQYRLRAEYEKRHGLSTR